MRVTTEFWVSALTRRVFNAGDYAAVLKRGAAEAGAVFILARDRQGSTVLLGPAPQTSYGEGRPDDRYFSILYEGEDPGPPEARLAKEMRFDSDIWIVEIEVKREAIEELMAVRTP